MSCRNNKNRVNPFTLKSDQFQISPAASPEILHPTVWRTWLFIPYSEGRRSYVPILLSSLIHFSLKGLENLLFELGSERVKKKMTPRKYVFDVTHIVMAFWRVRHRQQSLHVRRHGTRNGWSASFLVPGRDRRNRSSCTENKIKKKKTRLQTNELPPSSQRKKQTNKKQNKMGSFT